MSAQKALVIGLDGVPYTLLSEYMGRGVLPNLSRILSDRMNLRKMDASIPDVSSTSWTSFMTGVNPGEHGIFGFMELREGTYKLAFPNFTDVKAPAIWDILAGSANGKSSSFAERFGGRTSGLRSVALNIPQTFPAPAMNGVISAGFVCPDLKKGTYPAGAYEYLMSMGYIPDVDVSKAVQDPGNFFDEVFRSLEKREEAYSHFFDNENWDLFIGVVTETDRVHHFFFDAALNEAHEFHGRFLDLYRKMDGMIGRLYDRFMDATGGRGLFMTMSDHGFTVIRKEVYMNAWLKSEGYLNLNPSKEYFEQIDGGTRAFALDPARIYLNMEGKYPFGCVKPEEKSTLRDEIIGRLMALEFEGERVVKAVHENGRLYSGRAAGQGPDLVCVANDGFDLKGNLKKDGVFGNSHFRGMHTRHDAHCILPAALQVPERLNIEDLAGIILNSFIPNA